MQNTFNVVLGDWSHDGHGHTATIVIKTDAEMADIRQAYDAAVTYYEFDLIAYVADEYEDPLLRLEYVKKLEEKGVTHLTQGLENPKRISIHDIDIRAWGDRDEEEGDVELDETMFFHLWILFVQTGMHILSLPFEYQIIHGTDIHINGYGLFGS